MSTNQASMTKQQVINLGNAMRSIAGQLCMPDTEVAKRIMLGGGRQLDGNYHSVMAYLAGEFDRRPSIYAEFTRLSDDQRLEFCDWLERRANNGPECP